MNRILSSRQLKDLRQEIRSIRRVEKHIGIGRKLQTKLPCPHNVAVVG